MNTKIYSALAFASVMLTIGQASAQIQISRDGRPERLFQPVKGLSNVDLHFVKDAAITNMFEIASSELAMQKSSNTFVVQFAKEMIEEHKLLLEELKTVATNKGVMLPERLPKELGHKLNQMANLSGNSFDWGFQKAQEAGHAAASMKFKSEIQNGNDDDVKAYTVKTLPMIEMHYRMLLSKQTMMGPTKMQNNG